MNGIPAYFQRIQGRLIGTFGVVITGTIVIWFFGMTSMSHFADRVGARFDALQQRLDVGSRLELTIRDQFTAAETYLLTGDKAQLTVFATNTEQINDLERRYRKLPGLSDTDLRQLSRIADLYNTVQSEYAKAIAEYDAHRVADAVARVQSAQGPLGELHALMRSLTGGQAAAAAAEARVVQLDATQSQGLLLIVLAITAFVGIFFVYLTVAAINRPLQRLVIAANQFGQGDLNVRITGKMPPELHVLSGAFMDMADRLRTIVGETVSTAEQISASASDLSSIAEQVAASSGEVATAMVDITSGAEHQASGLKTVDTALDEIRARAGEVTESADRVRDLSNRIQILADAKRRDVGRALTMLLEVRAVVDESSREVGELMKSSEVITSVVGTIQGIARQTNMLALNAAIEAARAGEHGRGFAVVAEEVRKLADGSAKAADEVAVSVREIRKELEDVESTISAGSGKVADVEAVSKGAESAFEDIIAAVNQVREAASKVAHAALGNNKAVVLVEQTVRSVGATAESHAASAQEVSAAAEEQSAATEQMSAASVELLQSAARLKELVSGFKV
jgi:methyl-accepting chemotaxis protein